LIAKKSFNAGVISNVISSINVKLGGQNWVLPSEHIKGWLKGDSLCTMGLDVCHGSIGEGSSSGGESVQSVVAMCTSMNFNLTKYYTAIRNQKARQELVVDIYHMVIESLKQYFIINKGYLPSHILFYRDGVGEGMYEQVLSVEVAEIISAFTDFYSEQKKSRPKLTVVVVQKRNHLRTGVKEDKFMYNPPAGTLINSDIVDTEKDNFYLYSHFALQGTARPTHYQVLLDECGFKGNIVNFTFGLTHLHQGCPKSISIPSPVFYADKSCGRVSQYYCGTKTIPLSVQDGMQI